MRGSNKGDHTGLKVQSVLSGYLQQMCAQGIHKNKLQTQTNTTGDTGVAKITR